MLSGPQLRKLLNWPRPLPLEDERVRLLHEVRFVERLVSDAVQTKAPQFRVLVMWGSCWEASLLGLSQIQIISVWHLQNLAGTSFWHLCFVDISLDSLFLVFATWYVCSGPGLLVWKPHIVPSFLKFLDMCFLLQGYAFSWYVFSSYLSEKKTPFPKVKHSFSFSFFLYIAPGLFTDLQNEVFFFFFSLFFSSASNRTGV